MTRLKSHTERHLIDRIGWLRAAVLGANDGIVSTASLIVGVAAASADKGPVLVAGLAGLVAGAMSMAAGEYVSVSSQSDTESADVARERSELASNVEFERHELAEIYVGRGLDEDLALKVADQLMAKDALGAHMRDELGLSEFTTARPIQAALTSAATFTSGAAVPLLAVLVLPSAFVIAGVVGVSLALLGGLGALGAKAGGAGLMRPTLRVLIWGAIAMAITAGVGRLFGAVV
ncbi:MAG TPA: VIT family protein [Devosia sp.]|nr:VIT family protein [Devosia sp.]